MNADSSSPIGDPLDKRPPLKRIAEMLGISKMTVSRALREGTSVGDEMRARVIEIARQIGYQPDSRISQVMSAIRKSRTPVYRETLALIGTHRRQGNATANHFFDGIYAGASQRAQQLGFKLDDFHTTDQALSGRALSRILHTRGIRGVLIAPPDPERAHPHVWLDWKNFSCVLIGRSFANTGIPRVQPDHYLSCVLAMRRLRRLRYRRIGLILSRSMDERTVRMARSAFQSFHPLNLMECEKLIFTSDEPDGRVLARWMTATEPEVVIVNFEFPFPQPEHLVNRKGEPIDLVTLNWTKEMPQFAGIDQQLSLIGEHAIDLLSVRLQRRLFGLEYTAPAINVPGIWVNGPSIRQAPSRTSPANEIKPAAARKTRSRRN